MLVEIVAEGAVSSVVAVAEETTDATLLVEDTEPAGRPEAKAAEPLDTAGAADTGAAMDVTTAVVTTVEKVEPADVTALVTC